MTNKVKRIFKIAVKSLCIIIFCLFCFISFVFGYGFHETSYEKKRLETSARYGNVFINGDINSYKEIKAEYDTSAHPQEFLYYSIVMALEHDYAPAYYDAYHALTSIFTDNPTLGKIDDKTKEEAMYFLRLAAQKGDRRAQLELKKINNESNAVE